MHARGGDRGFTLVEVMIAVILTSIGAAGMVGLYRVETRSSGYSRHTTEAAVLAEDKMEQIRTVVTPTTGQDATLDEPGGAPGNGFFTRNWSVTNAASWIDYNVTVGWTEDGVLKTVTHLSRRGLN
ncbi:MAG TPA: prepilin-type N-terminal cleavage/methylation domain-containing protein [Kofleriaceae bacterium]|nr:prepilin-type N-terminal cleavage/methylation domain-containing protein [Kofleriaceae bacterium]